MGEHMDQWWDETGIGIELFLNLMGLELNLLLNRNWNWNLTTFSGIGIESARIVLSMVWTFCKPMLEHNLNLYVTFRALSTTVKVHWQMGVFVKSVCKGKLTSRTHLIDNFKVLLWSTSKRTLIIHWYFVGNWILFKISIWIQYVFCIINHWTWQPWGNYIKLIKNIPILPMAFLTFAGAKVGSAPPFV